jgi:hypothetical protein
VFSPFAKFGATGVLLSLRFMGMMPAGDHMTVRIGRRPFILACGTAVAWPLSLRAQQGKRMQRIGVLLFGTPDTDPNLGAFLRGLRDLGYTESQNIVIEVSICGRQAGPAAQPCRRAGCNQT